jgi:pyruvate/2-oxoglutarate dehydrogenase complex dihydrolipoamide acyltransferase (E2) component
MSEERVALVLPQLGNGVEDATIAEWLVEVGETVQEGDSVLVVETDKALSDLPSPLAGRLVEVVAEDGAEVEVGAVLGWLERAS